MTASSPSEAGDSLEFGFLQSEHGKENHANKFTGEDGIDLNRFAEKLDEVFRSVKDLRLLPLQQPDLDEQLELLLLDKDLDDEFGIQADTNLQKLDETAFATEASDALSLEAEEEEEDSSLQIHPNKAVHSSDSEFTGYISMNNEIQLKQERGSTKIEEIEKKLNLLQQKLKAKEESKSKKKKKKTRRTNNTATGRTKTIALSQEIISEPIEITDTKLDFLPPKSLLQSVRERSQSETTEDSNQRVHNITYFIFCFFLFS